jgi:hypothetical protein
VEALAQASVVLRFPEVITRVAVLDRARSRSARGSLRLPLDANSRLEHGKRRAPRHDASTAG